MKTGPIVIYHTTMLNQMSPKIDNSFFRASTKQVVLPDMVMDFFLREDLLHCQRFNLC